MNSLIFFSVLITLLGLSISLETPKYEVVAKHEKYEERSYPMTTWVSTTDDNPENIKAMFLRLFYYMQGANHEGRTLEMTAPMVRHFHDDGNVTLMLFIPPTLAHVPEPTDMAVNMTELQPQQYAVWQFGGFATDEIWTEELEKFKEVVADNGNVTMEEYFEASYSGFHDIIDRRNEIWFMAEPPTKEANE